MAFFAVTPGSFHQVAEVLTEAKGARMSISGWFHGAPVSRPSPLPLPAPTFLPPTRLRGRSALAAATDGSGGPDADGEAITLDAELLSRWIHPRWLATVLSGSETADHFAESGSIELCPFLRRDAYAAAVAAMRVQQWHRVGPPHLREYAVAAACHCEPADFLPLSQASTDTSDPQQPSLTAPVPAVGALPLRAIRTGVPEASSAVEAAASAAAGAVAAYASLNTAMGGPGAAWRSPASTSPDAALRLWQFLRSAECADFLGVLTGCGQVRRWAVEARALTAGSYTLVTDPQLQHRRRSGGVDGSEALAAGGVDEASAKRASLDAKEDAEDGAPGGEEEDEEAGSSEDEGLRLEACLCLLDNHRAAAGDEADSWPEAVGGYTVMLSADEELCTVEPRANALSVLGVPDGATTFVKFITAECPGVRYDVRMQAES